MLIAGLMSRYMPTGDDHGPICEATECTLITNNLCADAVVGNGAATFESDELAECRMIQCRHDPMRKKLLKTLLCFVGTTI
jgi:hypothetical protein